jgi:2-oxoisovalerate dehydrogenase E2 component (dihydrolipoyl transacylase)
MGRYVFKLPDVGEGTAEAEIIAWHVKVGDTIHEDQNLVDVMTDKATVEMTSPVSGKVISLHGEPGEMAPVGAPLVELEIEGEGNVKPNGHGGQKVETKAIEATKSKTKKTESVKIETQISLSPTGGEGKGEGVSKPAHVLPPHPGPLPLKGAREKSLASPAVRQRAKELGIELRSVTGSGPDGRITHADLDAYVTASGSFARTNYAPRDGIEDIKIIGLRRKIAEKMQASKRRIPHFAYVEEVDMTELENLREHLNGNRRSGQPRLTLLPFLMRALIAVLPEFPQVNAHFDDEAGIVHRYAAVHIGIATQTANGLLVPVLRHAETLDIWQASSEIARLATLARENKAAKDDLTGSTITITSLGALGGLVTTPVINYPEVAVIGPNAVIERPVVREGQIVVRKMMNLSSSFDHRVVDGYDAASFIRRVKARLEHPAMLFMD